MSSFSNADTGSKPADPYTQKNQQEPTLKEKVDDLAAFVDKCKLCMMTTKTQDGLLASRCMALAARVRDHTPTTECRRMETGTRSTDIGHRRTTASTSSSTPTQSPARQTTSRPTQTSTSVSSTAAASGHPSLARPLWRPIVRRSGRTTRLH